MTVDIKTEQSVPTNDFINVDVDAVAKVRINETAVNPLPLGMGIYGAFVNLRHVANIIWFLVPLLLSFYQMF